MGKIDHDEELKIVQNRINEWYKAATEMNLDSFMEMAADDFVLLNPGRPAVKGKDGFREFFYQYGGGKPVGPVSLGESNLVLSASGDFAYEYGTHDHVILEDGGGSHVSVWKQLIVLRKIDGVWKFVAMSETNLV